jgi:hypothetical protein
MNLTVHPKVEKLTAQALQFFQTAASRQAEDATRRAEDVKSGAEKLCKAYAMSQKVANSKSPLPSAVAVLGLLNDLSPSPSPDLSKVSSLVNKHVDICSLFEEWSYARVGGSPSTSDNFAAAAGRFCVDSDLSQESAGEQSQIAMFERIVHRYGADVSSPSKRVQAIENLLTAVGQMTTTPTPEQRPTSLPQPAGRQRVQDDSPRNPSGGNL